MAVPPPGVLCLGRNVDVHIPPGWHCRLVKKVGTPLSFGEIERALDAPLGAPPLQELARGTKRVAVVVEDHTRPAYLGEIVSVMLERLRAVGIRDADVLVVGATAAHRAMTQGDFVRKLGQAVVSRVRVESHDLFGDNVYLGLTTRGTPVWVNRSVVQADLKVAVGSVLPHGSVGFGGGAKLIVPGVAGYETIAYNHTRLDQAVQIGGVVERPMRLDMEEAAAMVGLQFYVGYLMDMDLCLCEVAAGDPVKVQRALAARAAEFYGEPVDPRADVVVACGWPLDLDLFQSPKALFPAIPFVKPGGTLVWVAGCPEGRGCHRLVEHDPAYRKILGDGFAAAMSRAGVVFASPGVAEGVARELIPDGIEVVADPGRAIADAFARGPSRGLATILFSSPMTVAQEGC